MSAEIRNYDELKYFIELEEKRRLEESKRLAEMRDRIDLDRMKERTLPYPPYPHGHE